MNVGTLTNKTVKLETLTPSNMVFNSDLSKVPPSDLTVLSNQLNSRTLLGTDVTKSIVSRVLHHSHFGKDFRSVVPKIGELISVN